MTGLFVIAVLGFIFVKPAPFDYSKVTIEHGVNDDILIRRSVDAALSDFTTKEFLLRYDNPRMEALVSYISPHDISIMKANSTEVAALPDSTKLIMVLFDSHSDNSVSERPMVVAYLDPETYKVYGVYKAYW